MSRLEEIDEQELRDELERYEQRRPIMRLVAAIIYKKGPSVPTLAEWLDVREATIYGWFDRIEAEPITEAVHDRQRSGRPPRLSSADRAAFFGTLQAPPSAVGFKSESWTPELVKTHLEEEYGISYTNRHIRRLMKEAGIR